MVTHQIVLVTALLLIASAGAIVSAVSAHKTSSKTNQLRRISAYSSSTALLASVVIYIHQMRLAFNLPESVSFVERLHILLPTDRIGSWMNDGALLLAFCAAEKARLALVVGNIALLLLWWNVFVGV